jgi:hypothetical protein
MQSILAGSELNNTKHGEISDLTTQNNYYHSTYNTSIIGLNISGSAGTTTVRPFDQYFIQGQVKRLESESVTEDFGSKIISTQSNYFYEGNGHNLWTRKQVIGSDGRLSETKLYFPKDITSPSSVIQNLILNNRISSPVKIENYLDKNNNGSITNNEVLNTQLVDYKSWGGIVQPQFIRTLKGEFNISTNPYQTSTTYYGYNSYGNPLEVSQNLGSYTSYLWGYDEQYPVAKVENATYSQLIGTGIILTTVNNSSTTDANMRAELNKLRNLTGSNATTYTYDPLIGMTSMTDPSGYTTYYEYDSFNRLKFVENKDSKVLKSYDYHYKTEVQQYTVTSTTNGNGSVYLSSTLVNEGESVTVTVTPNSGYQISSIKVNGVSRSISTSFVLSNITSNTVVDVQFSVVASTLTVSPTSMNFNFLGSDWNVSVTASGSWTVTKSTSWITISATSGSGNGSFTVRPLKNFGPPRTGTVTVTQGSTSRTIYISQSEDPDGGMQ